jgi:uncharacterized membrane protein (DUF2068 family)
MTRIHQVSDVQRRMLRSVAVLEFSKGVLVVMVGAGLVSLSRRGFDLETIAKHLLGLMHFHRGHLYDVFVRAASRLSDTSLIKVAAFAGFYAALRFIESYGLWRQRVWAEWVALISGASYLPLEILGLIRHANAVKWTVLLLNLAIVLYMAYLRMEDRQHRERAPRTAAERWAGPADADQVRRGP